MPTQTQHQIEMERRRQRIAFIEHLWDCSPIATPTKRCGQYAKARCKIGWNNCCGSHGPRECRKYSALQLRFWPRSVRMIRVRRGDRGRPGNRGLATHRAGRCAAGERRCANRGRWRETRAVGSAGLRTQEAIAAGYFLGEGGDQAFTVHGNAEDVKRGAAFLSMSNAIST